MTQLTITEVPTSINFDVVSSSTGPFVFGFEWYVASDVAVYIDDVLLSSSAYSVSTSGGTIYDDATLGGTVTLDTAVANSTVTVKLEPGITKSTNFSPGQLDIALLNTITSRFFSILRQQDELLGRSIRYGASESPTALPLAADRANKYLAFDSSGNPIAAVAADLTATTVTTAAEALLDDSTYALMRGTLELGGKHNLVATVDPDADNDSLEGYSINSLWANVTAGRIFICLDATAGAAVWVEIGNPLTTAGDIVYRGANRLERLALGGAGEVLASLDGGAPVWTRGNWVKIGNTQTASASAAIDFRDGVSGYVFDSTYDLYRIKAHDVHLATDGAHLAMQFYQAASLVTSANYAWVSGIGSSDTDTPSGASSNGQAITTALIPIFNIGAAAGEQGMTEILIPGPSITKFPEAIWRGLSISATGLTFGQTGGGHLGISAAADGVRLVPNSGNIDSGTFTLSGMKL